MQRPDWPAAAEVTPFLVNIAEDPFLSGCLLYSLPPWVETSLGSSPKSGRATPALNTNWESRRFCVLGFS